MKNASAITKLVFATAALAAVPALANHSWSTYHWASDGHGVDLTVNLAITPQWNTSVNKRRDLRLGEFTESHH